MFAVPVNLPSAKFFRTAEQAQEVIDSGYLKTYPDISWMPAIRFVDLMSIEELNSRS